MECSETLNGSGRTNDGCDEPIASLTFGEQAVLNGIETIKKIDRTRLQVRLKEERKAHTFTLSRSGTPPRTTLQLTAGPLESANVTFLVVDACLAAEDLLAGLSALLHLGMDSK